MELCTIDSRHGKSSVWMAFEVSVVKEHYFQHLGYYSYHYWLSRFLFKLILWTSVRLDQALPNQSRISLHCSHCLKGYSTVSDPCVIFWPVWGTSEQSEFDKWLLEYVSLSEICSSNRAFLSRMAGIPVKHQCFQNRLNFRVEEYRRFWLFDRG
jgi:hypothetical protein